MKADSIKPEASPGTTWASADPRAWSRHWGILAMAIEGIILEQPHAIGIKRRWPLTCLAAATEAWSPAPR